MAHTNVLGTWVSPDDVPKPHHLSQKKEKRKGKEGGEEKGRGQLGRSQSGVKVAR